MMDMDAAEQKKAQLAQQAALMASWNDQSQQKRARDAAFKRSEDSLKRNSGMRFDGEDRMAPERHRMQELQNQRWLAQQRADDKRRKEKERLQKQKDQRIFEAQQRLLAEMDAKNADDSLQKRVELRKHNQATAKEQMRQRQLKKEANNRSKARANQEVLNFWADDRLATVGETSCLGGHRVRTDHWRGMNAAQRRAIYEENHRVLLEGKARCEQEAKEKRHYQMQLSTQHKVLEQREYAAEEKRKSDAKQQLATQLEQQREAMDRRARQKRDQSKLKIGSEFFAAFGTTAR